MGYYRDNFIFRSCNTKNILEQFIEINLYYEEMLARSIDVLEENFTLKKRDEIFYTYILLDANAMCKLFKDMKRVATIDDLAYFKSIIIYVGKGCKLRKSSHLTESYKVLTGSMKDGQLPKRLMKILEIWEEGGGIIVLEVNSNSNHYISMCRENAMIQAAGKNLTNLINGAAYGEMKTTWTKQEIILYGDMLLFFALKKCIKDKPIPVLPCDMLSSVNSKLDIRTNYELQGVLEYFLEM